MDPKTPKKSALKQPKHKPRDVPTNENSPPDKPSPRPRKSKQSAKSQGSPPGSRSSSVQTRRARSKDADTSDRSSIKSNVSDGGSTKSRISFVETVDDDYEAARRKSAIAKAKHVSHVESRHDFLNRQHLLSGKKRKLPTWMAFVSYLSYMLFTYPFYFGYSFACAGYIPAMVLSSIAWILGTVVQHLLLYALNKLHNAQGEIIRFDISELLRHSLAYGMDKKYRKFAITGKTISDLLIVPFIFLHGFIYLDAASKIFEELMLQNHLTTNKQKTRTMILTPIWLLSLLGDLKLLFPLSLMAFAFTIVGMVLSKVYLLESGTLKIHFSAFSETWTGYSRFLSRFFYGVSVLPILTYLRNEMQNPQVLGRRYGIVNVGMAMHYVITMIFGSLSYWRYGKYMLPMLLDNFPADEAVAILIRILICLASLFQFVAIMYIPYNVILPLALRHVRNAKVQLITEIVVRALLIIVVTLLTLVRGTGVIIWKLYNMTVCGIVLIFLPALIVFLTEYSEPNSRFRKILFLSLLVTGICISLGGFIVGLVEVFVF